MRHAYWHRNEAEKFAREHAAGQVDAIFALSSIVAQGALDAT
jgi:DNA-binding LacI/PurR family transcriptional regulator